MGYLMSKFDSFVDVWLWLIVIDEKQTAYLSLSAWAIEYAKSNSIEE